MRRITTALMIAMTLLCTPALGADSAPNLRTVTTMRQQHVRLTTRANAMLEAGYMHTASRDYRSLQAGLMEELTQLHMLSHTTGCEAVRARIDAQIERALSNLAGITESAQLVRVALRML